MPSDAAPIEGNANRLSITYLLCLTAGIGIAMTIARAIEYVRFPADNWYYRIDSVRDLERMDLLVAALYGLCLTTFLFAYRSGNVWESPGKILAMLFAAMCVLDWGLTAISATVVSYRVNLGVPPELYSPQASIDSRGCIFGIWYRNFAPSIGYVAALPLLSLVLLKTRQQAVRWRLVWAGFTVFSLLVVADLYFHVSQQLPPPFRDSYFEFAISLPLTLLAIAMLGSLLRRERVDWWTVAIALPLLFVWGVGIALNAFAT